MGIFKDQGVAFDGRGHFSKILICDAFLPSFSPTSFLGMSSIFNISVVIFKISTTFEAFG